jgi:hypothetical protein
MDDVAVGFTAGRDLDPDGEGVIVAVLEGVPAVGRYVTGGAFGGDAFVGQWLAFRYPDAEHEVVVPANRNQVDPWWERIGFPATVILMPPHTDYAERNTRLVLRSSTVFGFPAYPEDDPRSQRSGTWQTIRIARRARKLRRWQCVKPPYAGDTR